MQSTKANTISHTRSTRPKLLFKLSLYMKLWNKTLIVHNMYKNQANLFLCFTEISARNFGDNPVREIFIITTIKWLRKSYFANFFKPA